MKSFNQFMQEKEKNEGVILYPNAKRPSDAAKPGKSIVPTVKSTDLKNKAVPKNFIPSGKIKPAK